MRLFKKIGNTCQNCKHGNNKKGKWKRTIFYTNCRFENGKKDKRHWNIFCEKKQRFYPWDKYKRCYKNPPETCNHVFTSKYPYWKCGKCDYVKFDEPKKDDKYCLGALIDGIHDYWEAYDLNHETGRLGFAEELMGVLKEFYFNKNGERK